MNAKQRVKAIMQGTQPDRVSVMCQLSMGHVVKNSGVSPAEFHLNYYDIYPKTIAGLIRKYEFDGALLDYPIGYDPVGTKDKVDRIVDEKDGQTIFWKNGDETFCPTNDYPIYRPKNIPEKKMFDQIEIDDLPLETGYKYSFDQLPDYYMKPYQDVLKLVGDTHSIHGFVITPLSLLMYGAGTADALLGIIDNPEHSKALLEALTQACITWVNNNIDIGMHAICVSSPFEGSGFISLNMYREFALPYTAKIVSHIKSRGHISYMHMCGSINDRLEALVETGIDGIECLDPPPLGNVELSDAVNRIGDKVFIKGNIDSVNTLLLKTAQEVYDDAVMRILTAMKTKRFILSSACSVPPNTPPENLKILIKAVEKYGIYR